MFSSYIVKRVQYENCSRVYLITPESCAFRAFLSTVLTIFCIHQVYIASHHPFISQDFNCSPNGFPSLTNSFPRSKYIFLSLSADFWQHVLFANRKHSFSRYLFSSSQLKSVEHTFSRRYFSITMARVNL